ncbi:MAG: hypothetical protein CEE40_02565 [Chloroflexi bacterium B3_Chlor]|nr:MAG: hypothetical protein CEE40_02565 [Chloroflexi bacterium B3_Chlor]
MKTDPVYLPRVHIRSPAELRSSMRFTGKTMGLFLLVLLLGSLIGSFYLNQASHTAAAGLEVLRLTGERERWRQDSAELRKRISQLESLSNVRRKAEALGFVEADTVEYLGVDNLPSEPSDAGISASPSTEDGHLEEPASEELATWWGELMARFESWMSTRP